MHGVYEEIIQFMDYIVYSVGFRVVGCRKGLQWMVKGFTVKG